MSDDLPEPRVEDSYVLATPEAMKARIEELEADREQRIKNHNEIFDAWQKDKARIEELETSLKSITSVYDMPTTVLNIAKNALLAEHKEGE